MLHTPLLDAFILDNMYLKNGCEQYFLITFRNSKTKPLDEDPIDSEYVGVLTWQET